jgi:hypothetical protein
VYFLVLYFLAFFFTYEMSTRKQCQCLTKQGRPCKNPPQVNSNRCYAHRNNCQPIKEERVPELPPDALRQIAKEMRAKEILGLCLVNQRFNQMFCNDVRFWRDLARQRGFNVDERFTLDDLKELLINLEERRQVINIQDLVAPFEINFETELFHYMSDNAISLEDALAVVQENYLDNYDEYIAHVGGGNIATPEQFDEKLEALRQSLREYDLVDFSGDDTYDDGMYFVTTDQDGNLFLQLLTAIPSDDTKVIYLPEEIEPVLAEIYRQKKRPITLDDIYELYPDNYLYGIDFINERYQFMNQGGMIDFNGIPIVAEED